MSKYSEWDGFEEVYLEDSFVLEIKESEKQLSFLVELVLTEKHPLYSVPKENEQYCYKNAKIIFKSVRNVKWVEKHFKQFIDAEGEKDYGNIDSFELTSEGYHLLGDWGEVIINSDPPVLIYVDD